MKKVWIFNHYATKMYDDRGGRHYGFAKYLIRDGYEPTIFCADTVHNSSRIIEINKGKYCADEIDGIKFVFIKTCKYFGNGFKRIRNMLLFYKNLMNVAKHMGKEYKPSIILASSVHPLTLIAGIKIARKLKIPCICEVRDLWPLALVEFGKLKEKSLITKLLYKGEHWIYKNADALIFTMEGGKQYIIDQKWDVNNGGNINVDKAYHINNGVDLEMFIYNREHYKLGDEVLNDNSIFKVVYAGSMRPANSIDNIVNIAKTIKKDGNYNKIKFILFGDGSERLRLQKECEENGVDNIVFMSNIKKELIPKALSYADILILDYVKNDNTILRYGNSQNKLFEYVASGKPIITVVNENNYSIIEKYNCGTEIKNYEYKACADCIISYFNMDKEEYNKISGNCFNAVKDFDFKTLTKKLEKIIEATINNYKMESQSWNLET